MAPISYWETSSTTQGKLKIRAAVSVSMEEIVIRSSKAYSSKLVMPSATQGNALIAARLPGTTVGTGVAVDSGDGVGVAVGSCVAVGMGVAVGGGVWVGDGDGVCVTVGSCVAVGMGVAVGGGVWVGDGDGVCVTVGSCVAMGVGAAERSGSGAGVAVGSGVWVGVGDGVVVTVATRNGVASGIGIGWAVRGRAETGSTSAATKVGAVSSLQAVKNKAIASSGRSLTRRLLCMSTLPAVVNQRSKQPLPKGCNIFKLTPRFTPTSLSSPFVQIAMWANQAR